ncbi:hypothetical protein SK128_022459 [Halocaridina rubra]|uniref:Uncharacterized protein n=1 Tax=Halocaridina rubra TaxID=373956 RepID=A0AAN8WIE4_HALRR
MSADITLSRKPGSVFNYTCLAPYYAEKTSGSISGSSVCSETGDPANPYAWDVVPSLPCEFTCPAPFSVAADSASCYWLSDVPEPKGIVGAALR